MRLVIRLCFFISILVAINASVLANTGKFGVGLEADNFQGADTNLALSYYADNFSASLQGSRQTNSRATVLTSYTQINLLAGLRHLFATSKNHTAYFTYGLVGSDFISGDPDPSDTSQAKDVYTYGVYVGVDYNLLENLVVSVKALPYSRTQDNLKGNDSQTGDNYFDNGMVSFSYLF